MNCELETKVRHELGVASLNLGVVLLFTLLVLIDEDVSVRSYLELAAAYFGVTLLILATAFLLLAAHAVVREGVSSGWQARPTASIRASIAGKWRQDRLLGLAWPLLVFTMLMPTFNAFKQRILPDAGFFYDAQLAAIDRSLFGTNPGLWLHHVIGSPATTAFFDAIYHSWFVPTTLGVAVVALCAGARARAQYMTAYTAVWIILGAVAAFLLPAAGPAFYEALVDAQGADAFTAVQESLSATSTGGGFLTSLHNQNYLLANLDQPGLVVGGGISAIPSLHNAIAVLFALASFRVHRLCGVAASAFAVLIWIGSVYLNWHYAIDGLIGAVGAVLLWMGSGTLVDRIFARSTGYSARELRGRAAPSAWGAVFK